MTVPGVTSHEQPPVRPVSHVLPAEQYLGKVIFNSVSLPRGPSIAAAIDQVAACSPTRLRDQDVAKVQVAVEQALAVQPGHDFAQGADDGDPCLMIVFIAKCIRGQPGAGQEPAHDQRLRAANGAYSVRVRQWSGDCHAMAQQQLRVLELAPALALAEECLAPGPDLRSELPMTIATDTTVKGARVVRPDRAALRSSTARKACQGNPR